MTRIGRGRLTLIFCVALFCGIVLVESLNQAAFTTDTIIGAVIYALTAGSIYAIAASGLVVTYTTSGVFNFAQGAIGMIMAFLYWEVRVNQRWPAPIALIFVILVAAPLLGAVIERLIMRKLVNTTLVVQLVVTIGLMFFFMGLATTLWDENTISPLPEFFADKHGIDIGNVVLTWHRFITIMIAIGIALFLRVLLYRSRTGVAMRAVVDNRDLAALNGAKPGRVSALAWALGCSMAAIAGILLAPNVGLRVDALTLFIVDAFAAAIIGRLRSLPWTFAGGLIIGVVQAFAVNFLNLYGRWSTASTAIPAIILFIALLALPQARLELGRLAPKYRVPRVTSVRETAVGMGVLLAVIILVVSFAGFGVPDTRRITIAIITSIIMLSLIPLTGWAGQISLAQITFVGVGAYAMAEVAGNSSSWFNPGSPLGLVAAAVLAVPFGVLMALPALRLQGLYLALASMAFAVMAGPLFFSQKEVYGAGGRRIATLAFLGIDFNDANNFLVAVTVIFGLLALFVVWLRRSAFGRRLIALRDSPAASATVGINLIVTKLAVFALAAAMAGFAGGLLGMYRGSAGEMDFQMLVGIPFLLLLVVGGVSCVSGALFGGISSVILLIIEQDHPGVMVAGIAIFAALTRVGPGLAALGVGRNPEGAVVEIGQAFAPLLPWRRDAREHMRAERALKRAAKQQRALLSAGGGATMPPPTLPAEVPDERVPVPGDSP
ncbi:MAG TPA: ABC transporter permease [Acidimicrobiia bacterium]|nr:ABC transporter permease [Acidimicrobiia bacterium]